MQGGWEGGDVITDQMILDVQVGQRPFEEIGVG